MINLREVGGVGPLLSLLFGVPCEVHGLYVGPHPLPWIDFSGILTLLCIYASKESDAGPLRARGGPCHRRFAVLAIGAAAQPDLRAATPGYTLPE